MQCLRCQQESEELVSSCGWICMECYNYIWYEMHRDEIVSACFKDLGWV